MIRRTDVIGSDRRYSQYRLIALITNMPRIATFMAPRSMSLNLLASDATWIVCSAVFSERRLFYLINRQEGRLMAVYQSCVADIRRFIRLKTGSNSIELIAFNVWWCLETLFIPGIQFKWLNLTVQPDCWQVSCLRIWNCQWRSIWSNSFHFKWRIYSATKALWLPKWLRSIQLSRRVTFLRNDWRLCPVSDEQEGRDVCVAVLESIRTSGGSQWIWLTLVTCPWLPKFI